MSNAAEHFTSLTPGELEQLASDAWKTAARLNPMCLIKLNPDLAFEHLRGLINGCLAKGMTRSEVSAYVVQELLGSSGKSDAAREWRDRLSPDLKGTPTTVADGSS